MHIDIPHAPKAVGVHPIPFLGLSKMLRQKTNARKLTYKKSTKYVINDVYDVITFTGCKNGLRIHGGMYTMRVLSSFLKI